VPAAQAAAHAQELAATLAEKSQEPLRLLKQHLARPLAERVAALTPAAIPAQQETSAPVMPSPAAHVRLTEAADGVLAMALADIGADELVDELRRIFSQIHEGRSWKAVVLSSDHPEFLQTLSDDASWELQRLLLESEIPIVAALAGNARGDAWLAAQFCDASVYSRTGAYSAARIGECTMPARKAAAIFPYRFGTDAGKEILLTGGVYSGDELRRRAGAIIVADQDRVLSAAIELARSWARLPRHVLSSWKKHTAATIEERICALPADGELTHETSGPDVTAPTRIALDSQVITATVHPGGIVVVKMEDRQTKNLFSEAFMTGVAEVFDHIARTPDYKVVILTGYDRYFASGGTKEGLLAIQSGKVKFTDFKVFQLPLDCKLPVIAAMQGHGVGAGWSLGMFADVALLSEESRYVSPYMNYGFTPGAGATWVLADKIGHDLARESLLTALPVAGSALKERGLALPVLPRADVEAAAMALARQIAQTSRPRLIALKQQLSASVHQPLEETYRHELAMHEATFVGRSDTLAQIQKNFYEEPETPAVVAETVAVAAKPIDADDLATVTATVRTLLANELQLQESDINDDAQFVDLGLDSISGVTWIRQINERYQISIEATKVYSYPTLAELSRYVQAEAAAHGTLARTATPAASPAPVPARPLPPTRVTERTLTSRRKRTASRFIAGDSPARSFEPIAVIGMAGQFPEAKNLDEYWRNIAEGKNCISRVPARRWDLGRYYQPGEAVAGKTNSEWVGALEEYDLFDPLFFNISPTEAENMDPQQRLFLQECWQAIENAGYDARVLSGSRCGVFVGCATGDYHLASRQHLLSAHGFTGSATAILAARVPYFLNLRGPCVSIDTACSSSLVAIAQACDSLTAGDSDLALAGGVYVMGGPEMHIRTAQAGMLSPEGKCFTFDQRADGFVPGEGVGVVMLKRLSDAQRDGDNIRGVVQGWGINQDGRTNGITAPNPESQTRLERDVYEKYHIDPSNIGLIEAHGTGTKLGDPIEVEALNEAFKHYTPKRDYCALGSVKSNIGHCLTAAGTAGFIKAVLALQHRQLPPTIHFEHLNEHIDLADSPFYVNGQLQAWEQDGGRPRQAAISALGFSGTNAHVVVGEYLPPIDVGAPRSVSAPGGKAMIVLSARTSGQLAQRARDLLAFVRQDGKAVELGAIAYTLQVGRQAMDERLAFVVSSLDELAEKLQAFVDGDKGAGLHQARVKRNDAALSMFSGDGDLQQTIGKWIADGKQSKLLELWTKGLDVDWSGLYGASKPQRVALPVYPFAKERFWIETTKRNGAEDHSGDQMAGQRRRSIFMARRSKRTPRRGVQDEIATVMATPVWQTSASAVDAHAHAAQRDVAEHHVLLCELPDVDAEKLTGLISGSRCITLQADEAGTIAQRYSDYALACFARIRSILQRNPEGTVLMHVAVPDAGEQALFAGLAALLKTAALENPRFAGQLMLVPSQTTAEELAGRLGTERPRALDTLVRYKDGNRQVLRWEELHASPQQPPIAFRDDGVFLITGGLGALGLLFTSEILARTLESRVVLTGRAPLTAEKKAIVDGLSPAGRVTYRQLDLGVLADVEQLIDGIRRDDRPLHGILHCAGMLAENFIPAKTDVEFMDVLAPKVSGTYNLDYATRGVALDFFVLFSSIAGAMGNPRTADYAAANAFLDQFASWRNQQVAAGQRHGRTRSINWPVWQAGGMRVDPAGLERLRQATGMLPMQTSTGLQAFYRSLALPHDQLLVVEGIRTKIAATYLQRPAAVPAARAVMSLKASPVSIEQVEQRLKTLLASVLRMEASIIDAEQAFVDFGLDSFLGTELVSAINKEYGTELSNISVFDYPNVRELARFVEGQISTVAAPPPLSLPAAPRLSLKRPTRPVRRTRSHNAEGEERIAIIGMSGRYPGASDLTEYWDNLLHGRNSIVEVPPSRWDMDRYYDPDPAKKGKASSKWLGALDDIDCFDPLFFRISPQEADYIDPHHRLFLQESYRAFEDAGYSANTLGNKKCGVYLGISTNEYARVLLKNKALSGVPVTSNHTAIAAARIAYYLNLKGPAISVDTACSSSLVAVHLACQALMRRETDMALAGGVTVWLSPESYLSMTQAGMLSAVGQCKAFDDSADGIVVSDGVGALVLKRLSDAEADHDFIYGVILGSGINQDGRTNGITAPSVNSQIELERGIYARYGIDPATITYVEAHGTGTKLGDPIEMEALATVFREKTEKKNFCAVGSVKSNIGHTTSAAGVAGVHKVLLSLRHRTLVPTLHVTKENSQFDFADSPFYVSRETRAWDVAPGSLRRAAVSSFGFSGTNAHLVIEEYPLPAAHADSDQSTFIVPLSARTAEQLRQKATDLLAHIRTAPEPLALQDVAYTLQVGREPMEHRLGFTVSSLAQLSETLSAYLSGARNVDGVHQGRVEPGNDGMMIIARDDDMQEAIDRWIARGKVSRLLDLWIRGLNFDWNKLHGDVKPRRIPLPAYPFARERHWVDAMSFTDSLEAQFAADGNTIANMQSIEDIINGIGDDTNDTDDAVEALKMLV
jgi:acyl transferase domain-containing protein/enoyl-CoA hydratase/carnithine racemase/acyl carrier protein